MMLPPYHTVSKCDGTIWPRPFTAGVLVTGKNGWYVGTPELGLVNVGNAHLKEHSR